ncbi:hypothetical protein GCM10007301_40080 [Azorhizobium oxalatiphilum]|uniref:Lipoprotein n=1 Tax=Azorhizobium oxalatiphilum TaxID=980631 RepID=A0A917C826_9HYPH|nr:hypothetical protein [Azorhizobium oxalatiphilum]GGF76058.1 hypothetical protein GCM10007301_40080 [Azorhizobium oxalatiphilum]
MISRLPRRAMPFLLLAAALALAGCDASTYTQWPPNGTGGLAERRPSTDVRIDQLSDQLIVLIARNARYYAAADTDDAEKLLIKIRRQSEGAFGEDAEIDIAHLKQKFAAIERQLPRRTVNMGSR